MRWKSVLLVVVLTSVTVAGCLSDDPEAPAPQTAVPELPLPRLLDNGTIEMDVPVDVVLIGFQPGASDALAAELEPMHVRHGVYSNSRLLFAGDSDARPIGANPVQPRALYRVHDAEAGTAQRIAAALEAAPLENLYNATMAEDLILAELTAQGLAPVAAHPTLVFLHLGTPGHHYRIVYETGHVDGVRVFGERHPLLVMDVSAAVDAWVGTPRSYNAPIASTGADAAGILADAARAATHFRLLQGPLYPPTLRDCHAVTLLTVVRGSALTETLPGYRAAEEYVEPDRLVPAWEALLGEGRVFVDHVVLRLPVDDPALDAVLRSPSLDALRFWMDENWDDYWVSHDGCEPYVSVFLYGDATDSGVSGIAMYDVRDDRRLSFSSFNDLNRLREDGGGALAPVFHVPDDARYGSDWLDFLYTHETGHLFGQRHPHDVSLLRGGIGESTYSSIWSAMSYQEDGKLPQFGAVDQANQARNRAGLLVHTLQTESPDHPALDEALARMATYDWWGAAQVLEPVVE